MNSRKNPESTATSNLGLTALLGMAVKLCLEGRDSEAKAFLHGLQAFEQTLKRFNIREDESSRTLH